MKAITLTIFNLLLCTLLVYPQQNKNDFVMSRHYNPTLKSVYSNVEVIDDRYDTSNMGRIWVGMINDMTRTSPPPPEPVAAQIKGMITAAIGKPVENGSLLIHLRFFKFSDRYVWPQHTVEGACLICCISSTGSCCSTKMILLSRK